MINEPKASSEARRAEALVGIDNREEAFLSCSVSTAGAIAPRSEQ